MDENYRQGICKLTGKSGTFIDAHILPKALTRPSKNGRPFYQVGEGNAPLRRWSSWYDPRLVIADGEKYLTELDTWAIRVLRIQKMVWSGWANQLVLNGFESDRVGPVGIRRIDGIDPKKLRLFFLSLLWRAAASDLPEFSEVSISGELLAELGRLILNSESGDLSFYPCQLTQLSTKGVIHNQTPTRDLKFFSSDGALTFSPVGIPSFRFYFDGLIAHMHVGMPMNFPVTALGNLIVGAEDTLLLSTVAYDDSRQGQDVQSVHEEYGLD